MVKVKAHTRKYYGGRLDNIGRFYVKGLTPSMKTIYSAFYERPEEAKQKAKEDYKKHKIIQAEVILVNSSIEDVTVMFMTPNGAFIHKRGF